MFCRNGGSSGERAGKQRHIGRMVSPYWHTLSSGGVSMIVKLFHVRSLRGLAWDLMVYGVTIKVNEKRRQ